MDEKPQIAQPQVSTIAQKSQPHIFLFLTLGLILAIILGGVYWFYSSPQKSKANPARIIDSTTPTVTSTVPLKEEYSNPFDEKTEYENPFKKTNPFDSLEE